MTAALVVVGVGVGAGALVAGLVLLLYAASRWAVRQRAYEPAEPEPAPAATAVRRTGWLSDEQRDAETWYESRLLRDLEELRHVQRAAELRLHMSVERAIRALLPPEDRGFIRVRTGEFALAGVR